MPIIFNVTHIYEQVDFQLKAASQNLVDIGTDPYTELRPKQKHKTVIRSFKYQIPKITEDMFIYSYFPRTIKDWNTLSNDIALSRKLDAFKNNC